MCTVQAPQLDVSQPTWVPVRPSVLRRKCTSRSLGSTWAVCLRPFTVTETRTGPPLSLSSLPDNGLDAGHYAPRPGAATAGGGPRPRGRAGVGARRAGRRAPARRRSTGDMRSWIRRDAHRARRGADVQLAEHAAEVRLDRRLGHEERGGDLSVRVATSGMLRDPQFAGGERIEAAAHHGAWSRARGTQLGERALDQRRRAASTRLIHAREQRVSRADPPAVASQRRADDRSAPAHAPGARAIRRACARPARAARARRGRARARGGPTRSPPRFRTPAHARAARSKQWRPGRRRRRP